MARRPQVVVVGAGLAGCATAWHLATDHDVILLEQGATAGAEATAQNAGMVRLLGEDPAERALALRTHKFLQNPPADWQGLAVSRITGALLALTQDAWHLHDAVAHLRGHGVTVEAVDAHRAARLAPAMAGARFCQGWWLPQGRVADPHALMRGYLRGLDRMAVDVRYNTEITGLETKNGAVVAVRTATATLAVDQLVLAAGAWSATLAQTAGLQRPLFPLRRSVFTTAAHPLSDPAHPWCWLDDAGFYVRPDGGGFMLSACDEHIDPPHPGPASKGAASAEARALAYHKLLRLMPALAELRITGGWTGLRTFAADRCPILGADPELNGLWWAAALGGFGVTCHYAVGEAVAAWMRGDAVPWLHRDSVDPGRHLLRRFPIRPTGELHRPKLVDATVVPTRLRRR